MSYVLVIAHSRETIDGLHAYLGGMGIESHGMRALGDVGRVPATATGVVVFPDDFDAGAVVAVLRSLRDARPGLLVVLVTGAPQRFHEVLASDPRGGSIVALPKPAFGWTILDAIRKHAESRSV